MALLLDSTVLIDVLRGRPAKDRLRALREAGGDVPYICAVNAEEVHRGLRPGETGRATALIAAMRIARLGTVEGQAAGEWRRRFAEQGITLQQSDCLIAAAALSVGATLATGNPKHFPMDGIDVAYWPVGE
jgi:predicted nucleic acid-binding protein